MDWTFSSLFRMYEHWATWWCTHRTYTMICIAPNVRHRTEHTSRSVSWTIRLQAPHSLKYMLAFLHTQPKRILTKSTKAIAPSSTQNSISISHEAESRIHDERTKWMRRFNLCVYFIFFYCSFLMVRQHKKFCQFSCSFVDRLIDFLHGTNDIHFHDFNSEIVTENPYHCWNQPNQNDDKFCNQSVPFRIFVSIWYNYRKYLSTKLCPDRTLFQIDINYPQRYHLISYKCIDFVSQMNWFAVGAATFGLCRIFFNGKTAFK